LEQKADGVFFMRLGKEYIEIGHIELSGGYDCNDKPRSTWDHLKGVIGNIYMLGDLSYRFEKAFYETFSKLRVTFLHTFGDYLSDKYYRHMVICPFFNALIVFTIYRESYRTLENM